MDVRLEYLPKRIAFSRETTAIRYMIAIIKTNRNILPTTSSPQEPKMYDVCSIFEGESKVDSSKRKQIKDYTYRGEILSKIEAHF